ncbi:unnamed protein product [Rotaria sp. Silwood1]|nr:unnamed protein product [Rotaria sp. Silwood1]
MKSNEIDPTFMYSQLLKEILIDIEKEDAEKQKLIKFCREQYSQNDSELEIINEFDQDYLKQSPLWWYSREEIGEIQQIGDKLWQVNLSLTNHDDQQLKRIVESIREDLSDGRTGWHKLAILMDEIGNFDKADELCQQLFEKIMNDNWMQLTHFHQFIGFIKMRKGDYSNALSHLHKCLDIYQSQYDQALETFQYALNKALQLSEPEYKNYNLSLNIPLENFSSIDPLIAEAHIGIGEVYELMQDFDQALIHHEKALEIQENLFQKIL